MDIIKKEGLKMGAYAWYYNDHINNICYWAFAYELSATKFAERVTAYLGRRITASDTSYASSSSDLERHQQGMHKIKV